MEVNDWSAVGLFSIPKWLAWKGLEIKECRGNSPPGLAFFHSPLPLLPFPNLCIISFLPYPLASAWKKYWQETSQRRWVRSGQTLSDSPVQPVSSPQQVLLQHTGLVCPCQHPTPTSMHFLEWISLITTSLLWSRLCKMLLLIWSDSSNLDPLNSQLKPKRMDRIRACMSVIWASYRTVLRL